MSRFCLNFMNHNLSNMRFVNWYTFTWLIKDTQTIGSELELLLVWKRWLYDDHFFIARCWWQIKDKIQNIYVRDKKKLTLCLLSSVHGSRKIGFRSTVAKNYSWWPHFRFYRSCHCRMRRAAAAIPYTRAKLAIFPGLCSPIQKPYGKMLVLCCHEPTILGSEVVCSAWN